MCPGVKLGVVGEVVGKSDVPRCKIGSGGEIGWVIGGAQV